MVEANKIQPVMPAWVLELTCIQEGESASEKLDKVRDAYLEFYGKTLPQGTIILKKPDNDAVSEGIGFAGLIFASSNSHKSQSSFWQVYKARKAYFLKENGVMAYLIDAQGRKVTTDSASDGDQDWIASEIMVLNKLKAGEWRLPPGMTLAAFEKEIQKDLDAFWKAHVKAKNGRFFFLTTDGSWAKRGDGREIYYSSYADPHFLRMFAKFDKTHKWGKLAEDVLDLNLEILKNHKKLGAAGQNPMPAKVFVRIHTNGKYKVENYYKISRREGVTGSALKDNEMDSIRFVSLRMPRAAILDRDPKAIQILKELVKIAQITGPRSAHILAGASGAPSRFGWSNTLARTSYGAAVLGAGESQNAESFFCSTMRDYRTKFFGEWAGARNFYYDQSLILQTMDLVFVPSHQEFLRESPQIQIAPSEEPAEVLSYGQIDPRIGRLGEEERRELIRAKIEEHLTLEQLEEILAELDKAPLNRVLDPEVEQYSIEDLKNRYPELLKIKALDENRNNYKFYPYLKDFRSHWNNVLVLLSVYVQKVIESNQEDKDEKLQKALAFAKTFKHRISTQVSFAKKRAPSDYNLASLALMRAELHSQIKNQGISFYAEGIIFAISALEGLQSVEEKERYPSKPDDFSIIKGILVLGDLYQQLAHLTQDPTLKNEYYKKAYSLYQSVARIDRQKNIGLQVKGEAIYNIYPYYDLALAPSSIHIPISKINEDLMFNVENGHITPNDKVQTEKGIYYYMRGIALIKQSGLFITWPRLKKPQEVLAHLLNVKKGMELIGMDIPQILASVKRGRPLPDSMNAFLLEMKKNEILKKALEQDLKWSSEELHNYAQKLEKKNVFTDRLAKLIQGELLLTLADRINYYIKDQTVWEDLANTAREIIEIGSDRLSLLSRISTRIIQATTPEKKRKLAKDLISIARNEYFFKNKDELNRLFRDESGKIKYPHFYIWAWSKQLEDEIRNATYIPNHRMPLNVNYGKLDGLIKNYKGLKRMLKEISPSSSPSYLRMVLNLQESSLHLIQGKKGSPNKTSSAEKVLKLIIQIERDMMAFRGVLQTYFRIYAKSRKVEALIQASRFKDKPRMKRVLALVGIKKLPLNADLSQLLVREAKKLLKQVELEIAPPLPIYIFRKLEGWEKILKDVKESKIVPQRLKNKTFEELVAISRSSASQVLAQNRKDLLNVLQIVKLLINENITMARYQDRGKIFEIKQLINKLIATTKNIKLARNGQILNLEAGKKIHGKLMRALQELDNSKRFSKISEILAWDQHALKANLHHQLAIVYGLVKEFDIQYQYAQSAYFEAMRSSSPFDASGRPALIRKDAHTKKDPKLEEIQNGR